MAENPLLPNDQLRALLALTKECARLDVAAARSSVRVTASKQRGGRTAVWPSREALIAGTMLHLQPGDALLPDPSDTVALRLAPKSTTGEPSHAALPASLDKALGGKAPRLLLGAAMAAAVRAAGTDRLVMVHLDPGCAEPDWSAALRWAQESLLPLIIVFGDRRGSGAFRAAQREVKGMPSWNAVQQAAARSQLPVLSVDGEDAVAVYRVTQESVLRARSGAGPALLWAMLPSPREVASDRPAAAKPVARLQRYLRARRIPATVP